MPAAPECSPPLEVPVAGRPCPPGEVPERPSTSPVVPDAERVRPAVLEDSPIECAPPVFSVPGRSTFLLLLFYFNLPFVSRFWESANLKKT